MIWYEILALLGVPSVFVLLWTYLFKKVKESDTQNKATKKVYRLY